MSERSVTWYGKSGTAYIYYIYPIGTAFKSAPGNYMFARDAFGGMEPIYGGQTVDLSERFDSHHKMPCIRVHGATHITAHVNPNGLAARLAEEKDIHDRYFPPCND